MSKIEAFPTNTKFISSLPFVNFSTNRLTSLTTMSASPREPKVLSLCQPREIPNLVNRPSSFPNIQNYAFLKEYHHSCSQIYHRIPERVSNIAITLGKSITQELVFESFSNFSLREVSGVMDLIILDDLLIVLLNFMTYSRAVHPAELHLIDAKLIEHLSVSSLILSQNLILRGDLDLGRLWLAFSYLLRELLGVSTNLPSIISYGVWVLICKTPNLMLLNSLPITSDFDLFFTWVSQQPLISKYFQKNYTGFENNDIFKAAARTWALIKMAEIEVNILGTNGSSQYKFEALQLTIQPDKLLLTTLFSSYLDKQNSYCSRFCLMLYSCSRYFGRFDLSTSREVIFSYLLLHQEINDYDEGIERSLKQSLRSAHNSLGFPSELYDLLLNLILLKHFFTRVLLFLKLERSYFPSLRFAQYVTNLMCMFNWFFYISETYGLSLEVVFSSAMDRAYFVDVVLLHLCCGCQASFICIFKGFISGSDETQIDTGYLVHEVSKSMDRALKVLQHLKYSKVTIISEVLAVINSFLAFTKYSKNSFENFADFQVSLQTFMNEKWDSFVAIWFGNTTTCTNHLHQLWRMAAFIKSNGRKSIPICDDLALDTRFFHNFENSLEPFRFSKELLERYMRDVVDKSLIE